MCAADVTPMRERIAVLVLRTVNAVLTTLNDVLWVVRDRMEDRE